MNNDGVMCQNFAAEAKKKFAFRRVVMASVPQSLNLSNRIFSKVHESSQTLIKTLYDFFFFIWLTGI